MNPPSNSSTRNGKIARLPHALRDEINRRLRDNQQAKTILPWLNDLPEVKTLLAAQFHSRPINKQNLSQWRRGGFREWLSQQQTFESVLRLETTDVLSHPLFTLLFSSLSAPLSKLGVQPGQTQSNQVQPGTAHL